MQRIAKGMRSLGLSYDLILSSPYVRARQTADIVAEVLKATEKVHISAALAPDGDAKQLIEELNNRYRSRQSIVLVGHEPYLSALIVNFPILTPLDTLTSPLLPGFTCEVATLF